MAEAQSAFVTGFMGLAAFEIWKVYDKNAPTLTELRAAEPGDIGIRQRQLDADLAVGTLALFLGVAFAYMTKNWAVLILTVAIIGTLSSWRWSILAAESR